MYIYYIFVIYLLSSLSASLFYACCLYFWLALTEWPLFCARASQLALQVCCGKNVLRCFVMSFFSAWCLCLDFEFNSIDSWSLYPYFRIFKILSDEYRIFSCLQLMKYQGPVVQNFVSLTLSLSPQLVNHIISTSKANTLLFFALQRILTFFNKKTSVFLILPF